MFFYKLHTTHTNTQTYTMYGKAIYNINITKTHIENSVDQISLLLFAPPTSPIFLNPIPKDI